MASELERLRCWIERIAPKDRPLRGLLQIISVVLLVEGVSVVLMFTYTWIGFGLASIAIGAVMILLFYRRYEPLEVRKDQPFGLTLMNHLVRGIGGKYSVAVIGFVVLVLVLVYNRFVSANPDFGDIDTLVVLLGGTMIVYPIAVESFKMEITFSLVFIGFVSLFLALPQALSGQFGGSGSTSAGSWYVHNMLVSPFSGILNLIGIPSSAYGSMVTIQFEDGTIQTLEVSAYCAGLYSFSIFLAAYLSFILIFERLKPVILAVVLMIGILVAYLGNIIRMVVIGIIGYYRGIESLRWAHENIGWMIFLLWSSVFWWLVLRYVTTKKEGGATESNPVTRE